MLPFSLLGGATGARLDIRVVFAGRGRLWSAPLLGLMCIIGSMKIMNFFLKLWNFLFLSHSQIGSFSLTPSPSPFGRGESFQCNRFVYSYTGKEVSGFVPLNLCLYTAS